MESVKKFAELLVQAIVDNQSAVSVSVQNDEMGILLLIKVAPEDMGKIIGREGRTVNAVREIIRIVGFKNQARVSVKIEEPEGEGDSRPKDE